MGAVSRNGLGAPRQSDADSCTARWTPGPRPRAHDAGRVPLSGVSLVTNMTVHRWDDIPKEQINPLMARQMIHGQTITIARMTILKGASVPEHKHHNEQITTLEKGRMRFVIEGREVILN